MPHFFDVAFESPASVEQVHSAFGTEKYWLDRIAAFGGTIELESLEVAPDGTVAVATTEDLRHGKLPKLLTKIYRGDLNIRSTETWRPVGDGHVSGEVTVAVTGAPGAGRGTGLLMPVGAGSQLTLSATVEFNVPLIGGRVESYIAGEFADGLAEIQRFTTNWINEHG